MSIQTIYYFNRYTDKIETEAIYGENFLKWAYTHPLGSICTSQVAKKAWFSRLYGWRMNLPSSKKKILPFIHKYNVDLSECRKKWDEFTSFNDFFTRELKPGIRSIDPNPKSVIFPADGRHLGFQNLSKVDAIFVKGQKFDLISLLGSRALAHFYKDGTLVLSRLCPVDYHRFHFPVAGTPSFPSLINGPLDSVNPIALSKNVRILFQNRRSLTIIETERFGKVAMVEIGAMCVGSILQTFAPKKLHAKGAEKGYFRFGGSTTLLLFEKNKVKLADDLVHHSCEQREIFAYMGDSLGKAVE